MVAANASKQVCPFLILRLIFLNHNSLLLKEATRRKQIFTKTRVPNIMELIDAWITALRPLRKDDFGFIMTGQGVMLAKGLFS